MRILFWGTPEFAAPPLRALIGEGFEVAGVVTQPDRPQGRSRSSLVASPIKQIALEESLPSLVDSAVQGPVVLTRRGSDAFVMLPLDAYRRLWAQAPRPPVIDVVVDETGA